MITIIQLYMNRNVKSEIEKKIGRIVRSKL